MSDRLGISNVPAVVWVDERARLLVDLGSGSVRAFGNERNGFAREITLDRDRTVVFDATRARRATVTTPQPSTLDGSRFELFRELGGNPWVSAWYAGPEYDSVQVFNRE